MKQSLGWGRRLGRRVAWSLGVWTPLTLAQSPESLLCQAPLPPLVPQHSMTFASDGAAAQGYLADLQLTVDPHGNAYFAARASGTVSANCSLLQADTAGDLFVAKYDSVGRPLFSTLVPTSRGSSNCGSESSSEGRQQRPLSLDYDLRTNHLRILLETDQDFVPDLGCCLSAESARPAQVLLLLDALDGSFVGGIKKPEEMEKTPRFSYTFAPSGALHLVGQVLGDRWAWGRCGARERGQGDSLDLLYYVYPKLTMSGETTCVDLTGVVPLHAERLRAEPLRQGGAAKLSPTGVSLEAASVFLPFKLSSGEFSDPFLDAFDERTLRYFASPVLSAASGPTYGRVVRARANVESAALPADCVGPGGSSMQGGAPATGRNKVTLSDHRAAASLQSKAMSAAVGAGLSQLIVGATATTAVADSSTSTDSASSTASVSSTDSAPSTASAPELNACDEGIPSSAIVSVGSSEELDSEGVRIGGGYLVLESPGGQYFGYATFGTTVTAEVRAVGRYRDGGFAVGGTFEGDVRLSNFNLGCASDSSDDGKWLHARGRVDSFVAKFSNKGELLDVLQLGTEGFDTLEALAVSPTDGRALIAGQTTGGKLRAEVWTKAGRYFRNDIATPRGAYVLQLGGYAPPSR